MAGDSDVGSGHRWRSAEMVVDDMGSKHVHTEVPVDSQTISKYSLVRRTVDSDAARKSLF